LETRDPKHEPRTLAEQRATWYTQAVEALGGPDEQLTRQPGRPSLALRCRPS
jgi:hypothetical protein